MNTIEKKGIKTIAQRKSERQKEGERERKIHIKTKYKNTDINTFKINETLMNLSTQLDRIVNCARDEKRKTGEKKKLC